MSILIDGYNLLHASGIIPRGRGPGGFERARTALLNFLAASLSAEERGHTTIVFDAREAPYNLPRELDHEGITVRFAPRDRTADAVIEELIQSDSAPKRLTVVSSDHQVQRAAHRRRARGVDSDVWFADLMRRRHERAHAAGKGAAKPQGPLTPGEVAFWLREFGGESAEDSARVGEEDRPFRPLENGPSPAVKGQSPEKEPRQNPLNPFPPGYAEDIENEAD